MPESGQGQEMLRPLTSSGPKSIIPTAIGLLAVGMATFFAYWLRLNLASTVLVQLLVVVVAALRIGFWQATLVSVFANVCLVYFIVPPLFSFVISDPQNWVALIVFEFTALVVSRLSTKAQLEAANAASRQREIERLYEFSRQLLLFDRQQAPGPQIVQVIGKLFEASAVALYDCSSQHLEVVGSCAHELQELTRVAHKALTESHLSWQGTFIQTLYTGGQPLATLALCGTVVTDLTFSAISSLTLATLERWRSFENESRAEGERQTERLRTAVLDALAHEFKTPLTTIRTASTAILAMRQIGVTEEKLVSLIDSETGKLNRLASRLLQTSRLDSSEVRLHLEPTEVGDIVRDTLSSLADQLRGHPVRTCGIDNSVEVWLDRDLMVTALSQIVDNAAKYSYPESTITIFLEPFPAEVRISVHNIGPAIPSHQLHRLFERFYRSPCFENLSVGTGLGLSVTKKIVEAHGGTVGVQSGMGGTTFYVSLRPEVHIAPVTSEPAQASCA